MAAKAPTTRAILAASAESLDGWQALARRKGESSKAHAALLDYVRMGPGRSLRKLHATYCGQSEGGAGAETPPTRRLATLEDWSSRYAWQDRLAAYKQERNARDQVIWEERQRALQEADFTTGDALRELAALMLAQTPQFLKTTRRLVKGGKGQPDREVVTVALDGTLMLRALKLASELQRKASGLAGDTVEVTVTTPVAFTFVPPPPPPNEEADGDGDGE